MDPELKAPEGMFRVIGVDLFDGTKYRVADYRTRPFAFRVADDHNLKRKGPLDDVYYVYDDEGTYLRGNEAVGQKIAP